MPRFAGAAAIRKLVHQQATPRVIRRRADSGDISIEGTTDVSGTLDSTSGTYGSAPEYIELANPRRILITGSSESDQPTMAGERESTMLFAYTLPDVDVREHDRFDIGGTTYEVQSSVGLPEPAENAIITEHQIENP